MSAAEQLFVATFGGAKPQACGRAPGRVNLLGEHTDYQLGFCLPMAIPLYTYCCISRRPTTEHMSEITSSSFPSVVCRFPVGQNAPDNDGSEDGWGKHIAAVAAQYAEVDFAFQASFYTEIPLGAGLSSSAALEVAFAVALEQLLEKKLTARDRAVLCVQACNGPFVKIPCGILDQFSSALGRTGQVMFLDCQTREVEAHVPWPQSTEVVLLVINTMVKHSHATGEYKTRVRECQQACQELGVASLREYTGVVPELSTLAVTRRARHVTSENARCVQAKACLLSKGAADLAVFGRLMDESHASLRDDYEVSCSELDFVVSTARRLPGVLGARMTGGGFGGCAIALCESKQVAAEVEREIASKYWDAFQVRCVQWTFAGPAQGAEAV